MTRKMNDSADPCRTAPFLSLIEEMIQLQGVFAKLAQMRGDGLLPSTFRGKSVFEDATRILADMADRMEALSHLSETGTEQLDRHQQRFPPELLPNDSLRPWIDQIEHYAIDFAVLMDRCEQLKSERNTHAQLAYRP